MSISRFKGVYVLAYFSALSSCHATSEDSRKLLLVSQEIIFKYVFYITGQIKQMRV